MYSVGGRSTERTGLRIMPSHKEPCALCGLDPAEVGGMCNACIMKQILATQKRVWPKLRDWYKRRTEEE